VTTELTFPDQQNRDAFAPLLFEHSVGVDVDLIDRPSKHRRKGCQRVAHVIAQVAIGPNEQRQAPPFYCLGRRRFDRFNSVSLAAVAQFDGRVKLALAALEQKGHRAAFFRLGDLGVELLGAFCLDGRATADEGEDNVAGLNVSARRSADFLDTDAALDLELFFLLFAQIG
jgi:hypothetical protein